MPDRAIPLLLLAGAALRLWQYVANPALWLDELAAAHNVITRPLPGPAHRGPLRRADRSTRLPRSSRAPWSWRSARASTCSGCFSLLCSLAALPVLARVARRVLAPTGAVARRRALLAQRWRRRLRRRCEAVSVRRPGHPRAHRPRAGLARGADPATTGGPGGRRRVAGVVLAAGRLRPRRRGCGVAPRPDLPKERRALVPALLLWAGMAALSVAYARARMSPGLASFMTWFWRDGFMPWPPRSVRDVLWPFTAVGGRLRPGAGLPLADALPRARAHRRRLAPPASRAEALVLLFPVGLTLAAAIAHAFPFRVRVVLFVVPTLLLLVAEGAWRLGNAAPATDARAPRSAGRGAPAAGDAGPEPAGVAVRRCSPGLRRAAAAATAGRRRLRVLPVMAGGPVLRRAVRHATGGGGPRKLPARAP